MKPRLFCKRMLLRVHAAKLPTLWSTAIRDQLLKRNRLTARGNYMAQQEQDATFLHRINFGVFILLLSTTRYLRIMLHNICIVFFQIKLQQQPSRQHGVPSQFR
jgi:hypothetical protein